MGYYDAQGNPIDPSTQPAGTVFYDQSGNIADPQPRTGGVSASHGGTTGTGGGTPSAGNVGQPSVPSAPSSIAPFSGVSYPTFTPPPLPTSLQQPFAMPTAQSLVANDPGYAARYQQGADAIQRSAAAKGSLLNGGTLKGLTQYGQDFASNEYNNYVNQQLAGRQQQASDYLNLAYGPQWQQNTAAVNQYGNLYGQYQDLINNNRNANNDYLNYLIQQEKVGASSVGAPPTSATSNV